MSTVDANVLVHASDTGSPRHARARQLLEDVATRTELTTLFWPVLLGYVRIVTNPRVLRRPLSSQVAMSNIENLVDRPHVRVAGEGDDFWAVFRETADPVQPTGNLVPDAHLAALMRQYGVRDIWTNDRDFRKFDNIVTHDPFA